MGRSGKVSLCSFECVGGWVGGLCVFRVKENILKEIKEKWNRKEIHK